MTGTNFRQTAFARQRSPETYMRCSRLCYTSLKVVYTQEFAVSKELESFDEEETGDLIWANQGVHGDNNYYGRCEGRITAMLEDKKISRRPPFRQGYVARVHWGHPLLSTTNVVLWDDEFKPRNCCESRFAHGIVSEGPVNEESDDTPTGSD